MKLVNVQEKYTYDDLLIIPKYSKINSRKEVEIRSQFFDRLLELPIISANMSSVTGLKMAKTMHKLGGIGCLDRFKSIEESVEDFKQLAVVASTPVIVSLGTSTDDLKRFNALYKAGATYYCLDVAHGAQEQVLHQLQELFTIHPDIYIIVGNFAGWESLDDFLTPIKRDVAMLRRLMVKVGVGPGSACSTRVKTGVGYPQLSAVNECSEMAKRYGVKTIADGGIKTPGDVGKAIAAGADFVMLGGMLAGTDESPGELVSSDGQPIRKEILDLVISSGNAFKKYYGSASQESYDKTGKTAKHRTAEGESFLVKYKGPVSNIIQDIEGGLRSCLSYVGANNLEELKEKAVFIKVTNAGYIEGTAHGQGKSY